MVVESLVTLRYYLNPLLHYYLNPETPTGFLTLKLLDTTIESWNWLCFDEITTNDGTNSNF